MGKQANGYIRQITPRDRELLFQLAKTGMASTEQSEKYCDVKLTRLKRLERSKYIKLTTLTNGGKETTIIQLDKQGRQYVKNDMLYSEKLAVANPEHVNHDLQLTETYYHLPLEYQRSFKCENELIRKIYQEKPELLNKLPTCLDATIEVNGETIGIEVIGKTYTQGVINSKIEIARNHLNCSKIQWINNTGKTYNFNN